MQSTNIMEEGTTTISRFRYDDASMHREYENELAAKLNYMTSRIRAILKKYEGSEFEVEDSRLELWWWTGLNKELVTYGTQLERLINLIENRMPQWPLLVTPPPHSTSSSTYHCFFGG
jgi:hypothetical protein